MEETTISTPVETATVETSSNVEPTETVETTTKVETSTEEPTSDVATAETGTQEPTLYAGKYKTVEELEKGYKESEKFISKANEFEKKYNELLAKQQNELVQAQEKQLRQAQARGFNTVEQAQISDKVMVAEFEAYANNLNTVDPQYYEDARKNLMDYYETANSAYLNKAKRYFNADLIGQIAVAKSRYEQQLNDELKQQSEMRKDAQTKQLAETLKTEYGEFLADLDENEGKAEALKAFSNMINTKEDMETFITLYNRIVDNAKAVAIKEYEAQKAIETTKNKAVVETANVAELGNKTQFTRDDIAKMSQREFDEYCDKHGMDWIYSTK